MSVVYQLKTAVIIMLSSFFISTTIMAIAVGVKVGVFWWESSVQDLHWRVHNTLPAPNLWNVAAVNVVLGADCRFSVFRHCPFPNITSDLWSQMDYTCYSFVPFILWPFPSLLSCLLSIRQPLIVGDHIVHTLPPFVSSTPIILSPLLLLA